MHLRVTIAVYILMRGGGGGEQQLFRSKSSGRVMCSSSNQPFVIVIYSPEPIKILRRGDGNTQQQASVRRHFA